MILARHGIISLFAVSWAVSLLISRFKGYGRAARFVEARNRCAAKFHFDVGRRPNRQVFRGGAILGCMLGREESDPELLPVHRPRCPKCQMRMIVAAVAVGTEGFEHRTFECSKCGHGETKVVASDPFQSDAVGWTESDLRQPH
jgi:hypothetical protein